MLMFLLLWAGRAGLASRVFGHLRPADLAVGARQHLRYS